MSPFGIDETQEFIFKKTSESYSIRKPVIQTHQEKTINVKRTDSWENQSGRDIVDQIQLNATICSDGIVRLDVGIGNSDLLQKLKFPTTQNRTFYQAAHH